MANNYYQHVDGDWTNVANWSTGAAPVAADTVQILEGDQTIDTHLPGAAAGINYAGFVVGPNFEGQIGTAANRLYLGTVVANIKFDGSRCQEAWLQVDAGDACTIEIANTNTGANACHLFGGTWTTVYVRRAGQLRIGTGATVTTLYLTNIPTLGPNVVIEKSATVGTVIMTAGNVNCAAAIATAVYISGGIWNHLGDTTFDMPLLNQFGGTFNFWSKGGTITLANTYGGTLDGNGGIGTARIITTLNRFTGSTVDTSGTSGTAVTVTTDNEFGGLRKEGI